MESNRRELLIKCMALLLLGGQPIKNEKLRELIKGVLND